MKSGDTQKAADTRARLRAIWHRADQILGKFDKRQIRDRAAHPYPDLVGPLLRLPFGRS
jgi:hypothetical protein